MKIIEPSFEIVTPASQEDGIKALRFIERMARISHRSEDLQTVDSWDRFIRAVVVAHGDWSVVEHAHTTVIFRVDRGVTHELVRHRLFSFTQESTRFVNYEKKGRDLEFIEPSNIGVGTYFFEDGLRTAEGHYFSMIDEGVRPQEARSVLPNALAATIAVTGNLRSWRWFFLARTTKETHPDFKRVTIPLLREFQQRIPILYEDIEPELKQSVSMGKVH